MYHLLLPIKGTHVQSERSLAADAGLSRGALRQVLALNLKPRLSSIHKLFTHLGLNLNILATPAKEVSSDASTVGVSYAVLRDGFDSWKIHFMNLVDEFHKNPDPRLLLLPPPRSLDPKLVAMCASIVCTLSKEVGMQPPLWADKDYYLDQPWFPSGIDSLKALNVLESPLPFRRNNLFIGMNFMERT